VKIAALSPQFVIETPVSAEDAETKRVASEVTRLRLVPTNPSADSEQLDQETREGLKRLSDVIRKNKKAKATRFLAVLPDDKHKKRALMTYRQCADDSSSESAKGQSLNKFL
jgi:hypothetical protein